MIWVTPGYNGKDTDHPTLICLLHGEKQYSPSNVQGQNTANGNKDQYNVDHFRWSLT